MEEEAIHAAKNNSPAETTKRFRWPLHLLNCTVMAIGVIGGPLVCRLYFLHGGTRKWVPSWLQTVGFPILLVPLTILYVQNQAQKPPTKFLAEPRFLFASAALGVLVGLDNYMYSVGISYLPVSTSSLLFATQLSFTAFFAFIIVRQRFTPYSINSVVLMTLGSVILGIRKSGDRPPGVSSAQYLGGFFITLGAAAILGFLMPCMELAYTKSSKAGLNFAAVMQFQTGVCVFATIFCTIGMLVNNDFKAIPKEAREYKLGETKYYVILASCAVLFQMLLVGMLGVIFCSSSLFAGVLSAMLLPLTEIVGAVAFKENFTAEKGMALALCLWGFASYFYGASKMNKNQIQIQNPIPDLQTESHATTV